MIKHKAKIKGGCVFVLLLLSQWDIVFKQIFPISPKERPQNRDIEVSVVNSDILIAM